MALLDMLAWSCRIGRESGTFGASSPWRVHDTLRRPPSESSPIDGVTIDMTAHISARLAWHMDGWNGRLCRDPRSNTYCVGRFSFQGDEIRGKRRLDWEEANAGAPCAGLDEIPPCVYSINAFGRDTITSYSDPPAWYPAEERRVWDLPPSTVCIWPYEEMYRDEVRRKGEGQQYDYDLRLRYATDYFRGIEEGRSLVFYYANYSNPFSEDDAHRYVVVGVSRVKKLGEIRAYDGMAEEDRQRYGGGFVWAMDLTSTYPDEGFRLPYHDYLDRPEEIERFVVVPPNARNFKYATRQFSDDEALELVERLIESAGTLQQMDDRSEDWATRLDWLHTQVGELWAGRGLYPGMHSVLELLSIPKLTSHFKSECEAGREHDAKEAIFTFLDGGTHEDISSVISTDEARAVRRRWALLEDDERELLRERLPRFELTKDQLDRILGTDREGHGISTTLGQIVDDPYALAEQFVGRDPDDTISFTKIDHGTLPSPELGGEPFVDVDDWRRLRALCVERLRADQSDVFVSARQLIHDVNHRLSFYPEWKRHQFTERYLEVDRESLEPALELRREADETWVYLRHAYEDERLIETTLRGLATRPPISLRMPMTVRHWTEYLRDPESPLASRAGDKYQAAIEGQAEVCSEIFGQPLCVLAGEAGTGKTTVVSALIRGIERTEGEGTPFQLLAPTGKAAERLREKTSRRGETATVHSFLAKRGWLNDNMTFKRHGGKVEDAISTYVIDESSMLSLELTAALFRAIDWNSVRRLILVGDPSQLPPIGRGRIFADVIDWLKDLGGVGELSINVRQMENRALGRGTGILGLADAYVRQSAGVDGIADLRSSRAEEMLRRVQDGGVVDDDLRVVFWRGGEDLRDQLIDLLVSDIEEDTGAGREDGRPWEFWQTAFDEHASPERYQVLTPYRGEEFGTESLNAALQEAVQGRAAGDMREKDGIALNDKVIQIRNRPRSRPIWAYCYSKRANEQIEVYNGELGFALPHAFDFKSLKSSRFRVKRFQVLFSSKPDHRVGYGDGLGKMPDGRWASESIEENLELAYALSIHKAQGSEFDRVYFVVPKHKQGLLSRELFYTGLTRASRHCTLLVEEDISPLLSMRRLEKSHLLRINASLFRFEPVPDELRVLGDWYEEGKIHSTLSEYMVRSKSEVIIANMLAEREIPFRYETPLYAPDGTFYLPDFTVRWQGQEWYWEHVGRLDEDDYRNHWETKEAWYGRHFPGQLITTFESGELTRTAEQLIGQHFA